MRAGALLQAEFPKFRLQEGAKLVFVLVVELVVEAFEGRPAQFAACYTGRAMQFSLEVVRDVARLLAESGLQELSLQDVDDATGKPFRIVVKKGAAPAAPSRLMTQGRDAASTTNDVRNAATLGDAPQEETLATPEAVPQAVVVSANAVGLMRATTPVLQVGDMVRAGQTVAIVESMKIPGEIAAPIDGQIDEILAEDGQGVEYGQPLLTILPALTVPAPTA